MHPLSLLTHRHASVSVGGYATAPGEPAEASSWTGTALKVGLTVLVLAAIAPIGYKSILGRLAHEREMLAI